MMWVVEKIKKFFTDPLGIKRRRKNQIKKLWEVQQGLPITTHQEKVELKFAFSPNTREFFTDVIQRAREGVLTVRPVGNDSILFENKRAQKIFGVRELGDNLYPLQTEIKKIEQIEEKYSGKWKKPLAGKGIGAEKARIELLGRETSPVTKARELKPETLLPEAEVTKWSRMVREKGWGASKVAPPPAPRIVSAQDSPKLMKKREMDRKKKGTATIRHGYKKRSRK